MFFGGCFVTKQWGWVHKYFNLVRNRVNLGDNTSSLSSFKIMGYFTFALLGIMAIFTIGSRYVMENLYIYGMSFNYVYYSEMILKNFFFIELFHYICCRSRLSIKYFPIFSLYISLFVLSMSWKYYYYNIVWLINLHIWSHLLLISVFSIL